MEPDTPAKSPFLKGWRTLGLAVAVAVVGALQAADWATIVPEGAVGPVMLAIAIAVAALRAVTDTPVGRN